MGRKSIFVINSLIFFSAFQLMIIYFIIIGDILCSFASKIADVPEWEVFYTHRGFYAFLAAILLSFLIFKKEIHELKVASYFLLVSILLFIVILSLELI